MVGVTTEGFNGGWGRWKHSRDYTDQGRRLYPHNAEPCKGRVLSQEQSRDKGQGDGRILYNVLQHCFPDQA